MTLEALSNNAAEGNKVAIRIEVLPSREPIMPSSNRDGPLNLERAAKWVQLNSLEWTGQKVVLCVAIGKNHPSNISTLVSWMQNLVDFVRHDVRNEGPSKSHWSARLNEVIPDTNRRSLMPWLLPKSQSAKRMQYGRLNIRDPFFIDDNDRRGFLLEATRNERAAQIYAITKVFNLENFHKAFFQYEKANNSWNVHVKVKANPVPVIAEFMDVKFTLRPQDDHVLVEKDLDMRGLIIDTNGSQYGDFIMSFRCQANANDFDEKTFQIAICMTPNVSPVDAQLNAIDQVSRVTVFGDQAGNQKKGYSLKKTVLAHGREMDPNSQLFFQLDMRSAVDQPVLEIDSRIQTILQKANLNPSQLEAFNRSTTRIPGGLHLVQGPPGTGKTKTAVPIILSLAAMGHKVLIVAGSNKAVDNIAHAVFKEFKAHDHVRNWCGQLVRFRTPTYQLAAIQKSSASQVPFRRLDDLSPIEKDLERTQIHVLVSRYAFNHPEDVDCKTFNDLVEEDGARGLNHIKAQQLKALTERITQTVLSMTSTRIVATTLSGAALDVLRLSFKPTALVGDESGQSLEGDHMIAMTMESIKSVCLFGDPSQLPPTVISQHEDNEGSAYLQRSLMSRLAEGGYPLTQLNVNYRSHTAIFDIINQHVYGKTLTPGPYNDLPERVGNTWDAFTKSRHYFFYQGLAGLRRLMISVIGKSTTVPGGTSSINRAHVNVAADLLSELYKFRTDGGDYIEAKDVMIISPYKGQRDLVKTVFDDRQIGFHQNLTVDACQGQEAPVVIFLMTKPSDKTRSLGFVGDAKRLNVAMSRAQKLMIIVGNLQVWDEDVARWMSKTSTAPFLSNILFDCVKKGHVLTWRGKPTVENRGAAVATVYGGHAEAHWRSSCMKKTYPPAPTYSHFEDMDVDVEGTEASLQSHDMDIDGEYYSSANDDIHTEVDRLSPVPHPISTPRAPQHSRMERRSVSPNAHPTAVRHRSRSPMQQDSKWDGESFGSKSRVELVQAIQAQKAVAESLEGLARDARHKQWAMERELSDRKSRVELVQAIQAQKAVAESLEGLARDARHKQWAMERELSDLDKMDQDEYYN